MITSHDTKFHIGVKAVIVLDGKLLLLHKRSLDLWEGPGGKVRDNESIAETLLRELHEELPGIQDVDIQEILHAQRLPGMTFGDTGLFLVWFRVNARFPDGVNISDEHDDYKWVELAEVDAMTSDEISEVIKKL